MAGISTLESMNGNTFLKLFIAQMQHQDPTEPVSTDQMMAQLAQFTTVSKMNDMAASFSQLLRYERLGMARELLGQQVSYTSTATGEIAEGIAEAVATRDSNIGVLVNGEFVSVDDVLGCRPAASQAVE